MGALLSNYSSFLLLYPSLLPNTKERLIIAIRRSFWGYKPYMIGSRGSSEGNGSTELIVIGGQILRVNRKAPLIIQHLPYAMVDHVCYNGNQATDLLPRKACRLFCCQNLGTRMSTKAEIYRQLSDLLAQLAELEAPTADRVQPPAPRLGRWVTELGVSVARIGSRPDRPIVGNTIYLVKDIFTTRDGQWVGKGNAPDSIDDREMGYLMPAEVLPGSAHLFGAVLGFDGKLVAGKEMRFWSDGFDKLGDPTYRGGALERTSPRGWANLPLVGEGSGYSSSAGEQGPWCWCPQGPAEVVCGGGLPDRQRISIFAVWQAVRV